LGYLLAFSVLRFLLALFVRYLLALSVGVVWWRCRFLISSSAAAVRPPVNGATTPTGNKKSQNVNA
jgi:hypothetical protein